MKSLNFFRGVCRWGHVIFGILRVLAVIGAVGVLIGVFTLSFMPKDFVRTVVNAETKVEVNMRALLGSDWDEARDSAGDAISSSVPDGEVEVTDEGVSIRSNVETSMENRAVSLTLIPVFAQTVLVFLFCMFLCRVFRVWKKAQDPLHAPVTQNLKWVGGILIAQGAVPYLCGLLIQLLTKKDVSGNADLDLTLIFFGFLTLALVQLLEYAAEAAPRPVDAPVPPFTGYSSFSQQSPPPAAPQEPREPQEPQEPQQSDPKDGPQNPDAF